MSKINLPREIKKSDLAWVDKAAREERQKEGPNEMQKAFGTWLESIGDWNQFWTYTFRPNDKEEFVQSADGAFTRNEKLQWCGGPRVLKKRTRNGGHIYGSPSVAPGWSKGAARKQIVKFLRWTAPKTRWALFVEGSKYRSCAHGHVLMANCSHVNIENTLDRWKKKHGRADVEVVRSDLGVAHYLVKGYVAKSYGKADNLEFEFSNNCRTPFSDGTGENFYHFQQLLKRHWREHGRDENYARLQEMGRGLLTTQSITTEKEGAK